MIALGIFSIGISLSSCNNEQPASPYDELLAKPPFRTLTDSIHDSPDRHDLYFRRGILLNTNELTGPALADFMTAWKLQPAEEYALGAGNLLLESKPDSAIIFLKNTIQQIPNSTLLKLTLARAYSEMKMLPEALDICNELLTRNPEQVDILKMKADLLDRGGKTIEAIAILETAYTLTPQDVELNYMLAWKLAEGKDHRVLALTDSLIKADSLGIHAEPYYYKGIYYSALNDKTTALHYFDLAVKHDYYFLDGYIEKGAILYDMKKYAEALPVLNLALTISPKFADAYYWIAKCQEVTGKKDEARLNYERAYSLDKNMTEAKEAADKLK